MNDLVVGVLVVFGNIWAFSRRVLIRKISVELKRYTDTYGRPENGGSGDCFIQMQINNVLLLM